MINSSKDTLSVFKGILIDNHYSYSKDSIEINKLQYDLLKHGIVFDEKYLSFIH